MEGGSEPPGLAERAKRREMLKESAPEALLWAAGWALFLAASAGLSRARGAGWDERWGALAGWVHGSGALSHMAALLVVGLMMLMGAEPEERGSSCWGGHRQPPAAVSARRLFWGWACAASLFGALALSLAGHWALGDPGPVSAWAWAAEGACLALDSLGSAGLLWAAAAGPLAHWRDVKTRSRWVSREELPRLEREILERAAKPAPARGAGARRL